MTSAAVLRAMLHEARADVIRFAAALARKVVNRLVQADPSVIQDQLAQALMLVAKPTSIEVVVHPADRALVEQVLPALAQQIAGCAHCAIREDPSISAGGCVIATAAGRVDATIETQLARIAEALVPDPTPAALNAGDGAALS